MLRAALAELFELVDLVVVAVDDVDRGVDPIADNVRAEATVQLPHDRPRSDRVGRQRRGAPERIGHRIELAAGPLAAVRAVPEPAGDGRVVGRVPDRVEPTATPGGSEQRLSSELVDGVGPRLSEVPIECVNGPVADPDDAFALLAVLKRGTRVGSVMEVNVLLVVKSPSSIEL